MHTLISICRTVVNLRRSTLACTALLPLVAAAQTAPARPPQDALEQTINLSPFVVSADSIDGYTASQTLSGTRLRTDARDIGAAMTILTPEFLDDIGAIDITSAYDFVPSTETYNLSATDTDGNGSRSRDTVTVRGFNSSSLSLNFFKSGIRIDRYNTETLSFNRGPNSILFGDGSPGGLINADTKRAHFRGNHGEVTLRYSDIGSGSYRGTFDQNLAFNARRFAVRVAGLYQDASTAQVPSRDDRRSLYLTATKLLFADTAVRVEVERGKLDLLPGRSYVTFDYHTPWVAAGRPLVAYRATPPLPRDGLEAASGLVKIENSDLPVMNWGGQWKSGRPLVAGVRRNDVSFVDESIVPFEVNLGGRKDFVNFDYQRYAAFIEQRVGEDFAVELAAQYEPLSRGEFIALRGGGYGIWADAAMALPDGRPNPYVGMPYIEFNGPLTNRSESYSSQQRLTASYKLDLRSKGGKWFNLGRYQFAALASNSHSAREFRTWSEYNLIGNPVITNGANRVIRRTYLVSGGPGYFTPSYDVPLVQAAGAVTTPTATPALRTGWPMVNASMNKEDITSGMVVGQGHFLNDRLVVTYGARRDDTSIRGKNIPARANGVLEEGDWPNGGAWADPVEASPTTVTYGAVVHATKNISAFYNHSRNYSPPSANNIDVWQNVIPPRQGKGYDVGLKLALFDGRLLGSLGYFQTDFVNEANSTLRSQGAKQNLINAMWEVVNPAKITPRTDWSGVRNLSTEGYEFQLTFAPTRNWRLAVNASRNSTVPSEIHPEVVRYVNFHRAEWAAKGELRTADGDTVAQTLAELDDAVALSLAEEGRQALGQRRWGVNVITNYSFGKEGRLAGWSVGSAARWRSKPVIGYAVTAGGEFINTAPFFGEEQIVVNSWIGHRLKLKRLGIDFRLGIDNIFSDNEPYLYRALDGGNGRPIPTVRLKPVQRTFTFSASFKY